MAAHRLTIDDLKRILRESAGADERVDLDGEVLDTTFDRLGYDSLALLEAVGQIGRDYGIGLDDAMAVTAKTPRELLAIVNRDQQP